MFDSADYSKSLDEEVFMAWLETGRESKIGYNYLLVIWDALEVDFKPIFCENRSDIYQYEPYATATGHESLVAAYDLYSESRIYLDY